MEEKERYAEDKCATIIVGLFKQGRTSEMYKEIRTLIKKFTPKLNVNIKIQKVKHSQKMTTFWQDGKNTVKVFFRNMTPRDWCQENRL